MTETKAESPIKHIGLKRTVKTTALVFLSFSLISSFLASFAVTVIFRRDKHPGFADQAYRLYLREKYPREQLSIPCGKNNLAGYYYRSGESTVRGTIVIANGMKGNSSSHLAETVAFVDRGWDVFTFDGTGTGESDGDSSVGLQQMCIDLASALEFVGKHLDSGNPILLYGHSAGGYAAAVVGGRFDFVRGTVCVSAFDSPISTMYSRARAVVGDIAAFGYPSMYLQNIITFGNHADERAHDAINRSNGSYLIIHGADDNTVPPSESLWGHNGSISNEAAEFLLIESGSRGGHSTVWLTEEAAAYRGSLEKSYKALLSEYNNRLPDDVYDSFCQDIDYGLLLSADKDFISSVEKFFLSCK